MYYHPNPYYMLSISSKRTSRNWMYVNTQKYTICPSLFLLARQKLSSAIRPQFTRNRRFEIVPKSLSNRSRRVARKRSISTWKGSKKELPRKQNGPLRRRSITHRRFLEVDSLLIHHETKRNYFTRARKRRGLAGAGTVARAPRRRYFAGA